MSTWTTRRLGRRLAALALTTGLALAAAACSLAGTGQDGTVAAASGTHTRTHQKLTGTALAELEGRHGLALTITSATREPAGCLTVRGNLKNDAPETTVVPAELRGDELGVYRTGPSLAGATVVDFAHSKRYYVLRDTSGHPLTTTGLSTLDAGESVRVFMQFPAPPTGTTTVGLQLPTFDSANIQITG
jgi:hypothetical protein